MTTVSALASALYSRLARDRIRATGATWTSRCQCAETELGSQPLPAYAENFLPWSVTSRPLKREPPTIDLVVGYSRTNTLPTLALFLSHVDQLKKWTLRDPRSLIQRPLSKGSNGHYDLSELAALLKIPVRLRHLVEGEDAVDDRLERARLKPLDHELDCSLTSGLVAGR
jgi:hypothetical protein